jgi:hypothetical protein
MVTFKKKPYAIAHFVEFCTGRFFLSSYQFFTSCFLSFWIQARTAKHNIDSFKLFYASEHYQFTSFFIQLRYYSATNYDLEYSQLLL